MNTYIKNKKLCKGDAQFNYQYIWYLRSCDFKEENSYISTVGVFGNLMQICNGNNYMARIVIGFEI